MEYEQARRIRNASLKDLINQSPGGGFKAAGKSVGRAIGLKTKAMATGLQEKADYLHWAKKLGMGGIIGKLTGRSTESIKYFSKNKGDRNRYTRLSDNYSNLMGGEGGEQVTDSSVPVLTQMFLFMKKTRQEDLKSRATQKSFAEEKESEAQRRHDKFIGALKKFTDTQNVTPVKKESGGSIMDFIRDMIDSVKNSLGSMIEKVYEAFQWVTKLGPILLDIVKFFTLNPIGVGLLLGMSLLALLNADKNPEETTKSILGAANEGAVSTEIMKQQEENVAPEEIRKKQEARKALLKDAPFLTRVYQVNADEYLKKLGVSDNERANLTDYTTPFVMPEKLKELQPDMAAQLSNTKVVTKDTAIPETAKPAMKPDMEKPSAKMPDSKSVVSTPIPPTPSSSIIPNLITQNNDLNTSAIAGIMPAPGPIVSGTSSAGSIPDTQVTTSASQRDNTHILNKVVKASKANGY